MATNENKKKRKKEAPSYYFNSFKLFQFVSIIHFKIMNEETNENNENNYCHE